MRGTIVGGMLPRNLRVRWMPTGLTHRRPDRPRALRVWVRVARASLALGRHIYGDEGADGVGSLGFELVAEFLEASEPADEGVKGVLGVGGAGVWYDENL